ncbi:hypothetical protein ACPCYY_20450, partial [Bacillus pumilus]
NKDIAHKEWEVPWMDSVTRNFALFLSKSSLRNHIARNWGIAVASKKIIGGEDLESVSSVSKR